MTRGYASCRGREALLEGVEVGCSPIESLRSGPVWLSHCRFIISIPELSSLCRLLTSHQGWRIPGGSGSHHTNAYTAPQALLHGAWGCALSLSQAGCGWPLPMSPDSLVGYCRQFSSGQELPHPSSILWPHPETNSQRLRSDTQPVSDRSWRVHCSVWPSVGKPKACSTHPCRGSPWAWAPLLLLEPTYSYSPYWLSPSPASLPHALCFLGSPLKETTCTETLHTGLL